LVVEHTDDAGLHLRMKVGFRFRNEEEAQLGSRFGLQQKQLGAHEEDVIQPSLQPL
jgi:hypothetical protein